MTQTRKFIEEIEIELNNLIEEEEIKEIEYENGMCGFSFNSSTLMYYCNDCALHETSCLCSECFENSPCKIEGHDYKPVFFDFGTCDCGTEGTWKTEGFCNKHKGINIKPPINNLLKNQILIIFFKVFDKIQRLINQRISSLSSKREELVIGLKNHSKNIDLILLLKWLNEKLSNFPIIWAIISSKIPVELLVKGGTLEQGEIYDLIVELIYKLHLHPKFFDKFVPLFLKEYKEMHIRQFTLSSISESDNVIELVQFGINIFSKSQISNHWKFSLEIVLETFLENLFVSTIEDDGHAEHEYLDMTSDYITKLTFHHILSDYLSLFEVNSSIEYIFELWDLFLEVLRKIQGMRAFKRVPENVEEFYDDDSYIPAYEIEQLITKAFPSIEVDIDSIEYIHQLIEEINDWSEENSSIFEDLDLIEINGFNVIDFNLLTGFISMHLPLHRLLSYLINGLVSKYPDKDELLNEIFPKEKANLLFIFIHVLRLRALCSQIYMRKWIRNGGTIGLQATIQLGDEFGAHAIQNDIMLLQVWSCLNPELFLYNCISEFDLLPFNPECDTESLSYLLKLIITVLTSRLRIGKNRIEILREHIIHILAIKTTKFSDLITRIPKRKGTREYTYNEIGEIVREVANISGDKLILKKQAWNEFRGCYYEHYSPMEAESSVSRYSTSTDKSHPIPKYTNTFKSFNSLNKLLDCPLLQEIIIIGLMKDESSLNGFLLDLLYLTLNHQKIPSESSEDSQTYKGFFIKFPSLNIYSNSHVELETPIGNVCLIKLISSIEDEEDKIRRISFKFREYEPCSNKLKTEMKELIPNSRQRAILLKKRINERMEQQKKRFLDKHSELIPETLETGDIECSLCHEQKSELMGILCYVNSNPSKVFSDNHPRISIISCGHMMHSDCRTTFLDSLIQSRRNGDPFEGSNVCDLNQVECLCPLDRQITNSMIPIITDEILQFTTIDLEENPGNFQDIWNYLKSIIPIEPLNLSLPLRQFINTFGSHLSLHIKGNPWEYNETEIINWIVNSCSTILLKMSLAFNDYDFYPSIHDKLAAKTLYRLLCIICRDNPSIRINLFNEVIDSMFILTNTHLFNPSIDLFENLILIGGLLSASNELLDLLFQGIYPLFYIRILESLDLRGSPESLSEEEIIIVNQRMNLYIQGLYLLIDNDEFKLNIPSTDKMLEDLNVLKLWNYWGESWSGPELNLNPFKFNVELPIDFLELWAQNVGQLNIGISLVSGNKVDLEEGNQDIAIVPFGENAGSITSYKKRYGILNLGSIYLDEWGEEDIGMIRGRKLKLSMEKLRSFYQMFIMDTLIHREIKTARLMATSAFI